jgi:predicted dehydrogenase
MKKLTRRKFLKTSASVVGASLAGPLILRFPLFGEDAPSNRLNVALIGCGDQGTNADLWSLQAANVNVIAVCDVDKKLAKNAVKVWGQATSGAGGVPKIYSDYRELLDREKSLEAVVIATPDHWHAPLSRHFMMAGKHVYCEKPLTRTLGEARDLAEFATRAKVVTQMGNQGSSFATLRRGVEIIQAGALGTITEVHAIAPAERYQVGLARPPGADPIPDGFNWDCWLGPAPVRPYKEKIYHPYQWHGWYDFGSGQLGNWGCHLLNLPVRALQLGYPEKIEIDGTGFGPETYWTGGKVTFHFTSKQGPVKIFWYENQPLPEAFRDIATLYWKYENLSLMEALRSAYHKRKEEGLLIVGEKGSIYTDTHNGGALIKLKDEPRFRDILHHAATKDIAQTLPRVHDHVAEWVGACQGGAPTYSNFEVAGHLTEIILAGVLAIRLGHGMDYDGPGLKVPGVPAADAFIRQDYRPTWLA